MKNKFTFISFLAAATMLLTACGGGMPFAAAPTSTAVPLITEVGALNVEGRVVPRSFTTLAFPVSGEIEKIVVEEGAVVEQGALLAGLGKREPLEAVLSSAKLEELSAQQALDMLNRKADLSAKQAQQILAEAEKAVVDARKAVADLDTDAYRDTLDDKETAVQNAKDTLKDAKDELEKRKDLDPDNQVRKDAEQKVEDDQKALDTVIRDRDL